MAATITIDIDYSDEGGEQTRFYNQNKYGITIVLGDWNFALITGTKENLKKFIFGEDYGMEYEDALEFFPQIFNS